MALSSLFLLSGALSHPGLFQLGAFYFQTTTTSELGSAGPPLLEEGQGYAYDDRV